MKVGDYIQWHINGMDQFKEPPKIKSFSDCNKYVFIEGTTTGLPIDQVRVLVSRRGKSITDGSAIDEANCSFCSHKFENEKVWECKCWCGRRWCSRGCAIADDYCFEGDAYDTDHISCKHCRDTFQEKWKKW